MSDSARQDAEYELVMRLLNARTGLRFREDQRDSVQQGIARSMERANVASIHQFAHQLEHDAQVLDDLVVELTVGETYFFREPKQINCLETEIIPEIQQRRGLDHTIRIWCAGCASGEEPYSVAMLCETAGISRRTHILATDISTEALAKAREASYRQWSLRGDCAERARPYLRFESDVYGLDPAIRDQVQFEFLNLAMDVYPSYVTGTMGLDVILCRNVMIYFDHETIREIARRFFHCLAPGGWLITASGDPPLSGYADFESVATTAGYFYRRPLRKESTAQPEVSQVSRWFRLDEPAAPTDQDQTADEFKPPGAKSSPTTISAASVVEQARDALEQGLYDRAAELTKDLTSHAEACVLHIKALANIDTLSAVKKCSEATEHHSVSAELHYLHAVLLMEVNHDEEALQAAQRVVFLDRSLSIAHFTLGSILQRRGSLDDARRHFRNACNLCQQRPPNEVVGLSEGETAQQLAEAAAAHLTSIEAAMK